MRKYIPIQPKHYMHACEDTIGLPIWVKTGTFLAVLNINRPLVVQEEQALTASPQARASHTSTSGKTSDVLALVRSSKAAVRQCSSATHAGFSDASLSMSSDLRDSVPGEYSRKVRLAHCKCR